MNVEKMIELLTFDNEMIFMTPDDGAHIAAKLRELEAENTRLKEGWEISSRQYVQAVTRKAVTNDN